MDKPRHPQVIRTWKVERIRKPGAASRGKVYQPKPAKKSKRILQPARYEIDYGTLHGLLGRTNIFSWLNSTSLKGHSTSLLWRHCGHCAGIHRHLRVIP